LKIIFSCILFKTSAADFSNFDTDFTAEQPKLSQIDKNLLKTIDTAIFRGFSFINENFKSNGK
jgi:hypothetical protein